MHAARAAPKQQGPVCEALVAALVAMQLGSVAVGGELAWAWSNGQAICGMPVTWCEVARDSLASENTIRMRWELECGTVENGIQEQMQQ